MYPLGYIQKGLLKLLQYEASWVSTSYLTKKHYERDYLTGGDINTIVTALKNLFRRNLVSGKKVEREAKNKNKGGINHNKERRKIWMWKITEKGLKCINGENR